MSYSSRTEALGLPRRARVPPSVFEITLVDRYIDPSLKQEREVNIDHVTRGEGDVAPETHVREAKIFLKELDSMIPFGMTDRRSGDTREVTDSIAGTHLHPWIAAIKRPQGTRRLRRGRQVYISVVEPEAWRSVELDVRSEHLETSPSRPSIFTATYRDHVSRNGKPMRPWSLGFDPDASRMASPPQSHMEIAKRFAARVPDHFPPGSCNQRPSCGLSIGLETLAHGEHPHVEMMERPLGRQEAQEGLEVWFSVKDL